MAEMGPKFYNENHKRQDNWYADAHYYKKKRIDALNILSSIIWRNTIIPKT